METPNKSKIENIGSDEDLKRTLITDGHAFIVLPKTHEIGIIDPNQALENLSIIVGRCKMALANEFYIEFFSLKIQFLEFYLRIFWVRKNPSGTILTSKIIKYFGAIIDDCEKFGFDATLIDKLKKFNSARVKAIHKYLMGGISEVELGEISNKYAKLGNEIKDYVLSQVGVFITDPNHIPTESDSMIFTKRIK